MAGLILLKEFHNWTEAEAVDAYLFDAPVFQYALNLGSDNLSLCERSTLSKGYSRRKVSSKDFRRYHQ